MKRFTRENGLSLVLFGLFVVILLGGQVLTGQREHNRAQLEHGSPKLGLMEYVVTPHFLETTMENWESEFLQMFVYIVLTAFLYQKGSSESKDPSKEEKVDQPSDPRKVSRDAPWPVRKGGWVLRIYENSLALAFFILFAISFVLHALGGVGAFNDELLEHGAPPMTLAQYMGSARFWFESFQNWQSEFLAIGSMVVLSIWLRQRGSPESKPVAAPHHSTGIS